MDTKAFGSKIRAVFANLKGAMVKKIIIIH